MSAFTALAAEEIKSRVPLSWAKVRSAEDYVITARFLFACRHVMAGAPAATCIWHRSGGLFCLACMEHHHLPRHDDREEHRCDECRRVVGRIRPVICITKIAGVRIGEPRGRRRMFSGPVSFIGVGCCTPCWGAA